MKTWEVLRDAARVVRRGWTKNTRARDEEWNALSPNHQNATKWCMLGAICKAAGDDHLGDLLRAEIEGFCGFSITWWNDREGISGEAAALKLEELADRMEKAASAATPAETLV